MVAPGSAENDLSNVIATPSFLGRQYGAIEGGNA